MALKLGDKLNYNSMKQSAMESKSIRSVIPPRAGVTFSPGQIIEFEIPGNRNEFLDVVNNLKIKLPVEVAGATATYDRAGAYSLVNRWEFVQNGIVLVNVPRANVLLTGLADFQMSAEYKSSQGRLLEGMEGDCLRGAIQAVGTRTFYLSTLATDLHMTTPHRDLYLGSSAPIVLRITLESNATALQSAGNDATYSITRPELLINTTFLYKESMDELSRAVKGQYRMLCNSYDHMSATIAQGTTNAHIKLSFAKSSLERILFFMRPSAHTTSGTKFSLGSRGTATLQSYQLDVAGTLIPQVPIKTDGAEEADFMYHLLHSDNIASNYSAGVGGLMNAYTANPSNVEPGTGSLGSAPQLSKQNPFKLPGAPTGGGEYGKAPDGVTTCTASNIGTFVGAVNLESGLITSQNSPLYSGVSTKNGVDMYIDMVFENVPVDMTVDFFSLSTEMIELDPDTNLWRKLS